MKQTWRWFGPNDLVSIDDICQAGSEGVVSALHHIPTGDVWHPDEITNRKLQIESMENGQPSMLNWDVVESLPVSEEIKKQSGDWRQHIENYKESLINLAASGLDVVCYNFMPVLDWTRTDLSYQLSTGATCMRFDLTDFVVFDIHILMRKTAEADYSIELMEEAACRFSKMDSQRQQALIRNVVFGLPGAAEKFTLDDVRQHLADYTLIRENDLRHNLITFLELVAPLAEKLGIRLCCHPDDPPAPLLGLPRIMSTENDYRKIIEAVDIPANGITLCAGSLGARPDNDLPGMMTRLGNRIHFLHLRNVKRETPDILGSFHETEHLLGDTDMVALVQAVLDEETRRRDSGWANSSIPFRPDHGQDILGDLKHNAQPGYSAIGRLKGLAEIRGVISALTHPLSGATTQICD